MPAAGAAGAATALTTRNVALYGLVSSAAAVGVVVSAFRQRSNFYSAAVMLGGSNGCMLVLFNFGLFLTIVFGKACQRIFFGALRAIEIEHLYERSWYAVTESLLAMTMFRDEFDSSFVILFGTLLFLKVFHWLSADRIEFMEQSPSVSRLFHARMISILWTLFWLDTFLVAFAVEILIIDQKKVGIMIMFASEFMILWATLNSTIAKYLINCYDLRSEVPWEGKSMYVFFVDLVTDFLKLATYLGFCALIVSYYGLPLNIIRDVYITGRSFFGRIRDFIKYRAATRNMDTRFPDATHQDMRTMSDGTCIICREEMIVSDAGATDENEGRAPGPSPPTSSGLNETPKKLPCGHIFHFHCLRSWLERQQSCPTCRRTVFDAPAAATPAAPAGGEAGPAQGAGAPGQGPARGAEAANPAQTARDRLQGFLQQLQTDAQRAREQGDRSAREAAAAANAAAASGSFSRSATPRPGPSTVTDNTRTRNAAGALPTASATAAEVPPRSHTTSRTQSPNRSSQQPRGRTPIRRALINSLFHTSGASSPHHQNMFGTGGPSTSPPAHYQNMYGVGPSLNSTFARGSNTHIGPSWIPPPPWTFRPSVTAGLAKKGEGGTATAADAKEKASTEQDGGESKEAKDAPIDPLDAREAARAAALKRFEALGKGTASKAASSSRSVTMPPSSAQPSDRPAETARQEEAPSEEADIPGNPALIPLFDPLTIPSFSADSLPLPLASGPASTQSTVQQGTQPHLDARLSDAELANLSRSTRQGLEERLKLLERVQGSIWLAVEELSRALSVVPDDEASERINDNEGDEHQRGRTTRRVEEEEHVGLSKGKEKQREEEEVDN